MKKSKYSEERRNLKKEGIWNNDGTWNKEKNQSCPNQIGFNEIDIYQ